MTTTTETGSATGQRSRFNFDHARIEDQTARFDLPRELLGNPKLRPHLIMRPALEFNSDFQAAKLALDSHRKRIEKVSQDQGLDEWDVKQDRADDLNAFPGNVVVGWGDIIDTDGNEVEFSTEACTEFLKALPEWVWLRVRGFAYSTRSFLKRPMPATDLTELVGN